LTDEPSKITQEWFAAKPAQVKGQLELEAQLEEDLGPTDPVSSKPLTAAEVVARRLKEKR
jgi:hypothetical protein